MVMAPCWFQLLQETVTDEDKAASEKKEEPPRRKFTEKVSERETCICEDEPCICWLGTTQSIWAK